MVVDSGCTPETLAIVSACVHSAIAVAHGGALHGITVAGMRYCVAAQTNKGWADSSRNITELDAKIQKQPQRKTEERLMET